MQVCKWLTKVFTLLFFREFSPRVGWVKEFHNRWSLTNGLWDLILDILSKIAFYLPLFAFSLLSFNKFNWKSCIKRLWVPCISSKSSFKPLLPGFLTRTGIWRNKTVRLFNKPFWDHVRQTKVTILTVQLCYLEQVPTPQSASRVKTCRIMQLCSVQMFTFPRQH